MPTPKNREFDLVLWGATGFAGRLVAEYLADHPAHDGFSWAIAGRNQAKLEGVRDELARINPGVEDLAILIGDSLDRDSLDAIAEKTRVVCTTVGPYAKYGSELVAACIANGTDYCDLTGEVQWVRRMVDAHHDEAREAGARIVHCCGFDSIPSDLGTLMVQDFATREYGQPCEQVKFYITGMKGEFSGGTLASLSNVLEEATQNREILKIVGHPYSLNPPGERQGPDGSSQQGPQYDDDIDAWTGPFMMAAVNEKVVRRSNALLDYPYSRQFRYGESIRFGSGVKGALGAGSMAAGMGAFTGAMIFKPTRMLLEKFALPSPGEGPSRDKIENGFFKIELIGQGKADDGTDFSIRGRVRADKDPGYGATAIMLAESALCLALDEVDDALDGGVLTSASAMGMTLIDRLRGAGMTFEVSRAS
jgi:short subunit dehydrogenase-like uncharacterized protein